MPLEQDRGSFDLAERRSKYNLEHLSSVNTPSILADYHLFLALCLICVSYLGTKNASETHSKDSILPACHLSIVFFIRALGTRLRVGVVRLLVQATSLNLGEMRHSFIITTVFNCRLISASLMCLIQFSICGKHFSSIAWGDSSDFWRGNQYPSTLLRLTTKLQGRRDEAKGIVCNSSDSRTPMFCRRQTALLAGKSPVVVSLLADGV